MMKNFFNLLGVVIMLVVCTNAFGQEGEDAYKEYKGMKNGKINEYKKDSNTTFTPISYVDKKNEFSFSLGGLNYYQIDYLILNYRRSILAAEKFDIGLNLAIGLNQSISLMYNVATNNSANGVFSASVSVAYGDYNGIEANFGQIYYNLEKSIFSSKEGNLYPYISAFYVKKLKKKPVVFKAGLSYPFLTQVSIGVRF